MGRAINRTGQKYGALTAVCQTRQNSLNQFFWMCLCDCGKEIEVFGGNLHSGHTTSCGCLKGLFRHGDSRDGYRAPEYQALADIISRCTNPKIRSYKSYGARGIKVCDEWNSCSKYPAFLAHIGRRPSSKHSVDRWPDKNGNYEPGNVRWATVPQQSSNRTTNINLTFRGETLHQAAMERKYGLRTNQLGGRLKRGWTLSDALLTKP